MTPEDLMLPAGLVASKDLLGKLLGPTATYIGEKTRDVVRDVGEINVSRIISVAVKALGPRIDSPGQVSPRVLKHVINEGAFCEDALGTQYFGGLLATSRGAPGEDDRTLGYLSAVEAMPLYELRLHYVFYREFARLHKGQTVRTADPPRKLAVVSIEGTFEGTSY